MNYKQQVQQFLTKTGATIDIKFIKKDYYFHNDKEKRNIYQFTILKGGRKYIGRFGDSIKNTEEGGEPNEYDILACLTKYEPEDNLNDFMVGYGYTDEKVANKIYNAVKKEYQGIISIFTEKEMEMLRDIS